MALGSTVFKFEIDLSDVDRGVYESVSLDVARHPSESDAYLVARVLAYVLELEEGIAFSQGLKAGEEPAVWVRDLTGQLVAWIEVGTPDATRLHKASKAADRVAVYCHRGADPWLASLAGQRVHGAASIRVVLLDPAFVETLASRLERRNAWSLSVLEDTLYVEIEGESLSTTLKRVPFPGW
ncbi:MAG: YaeQ family protein [Alphaproteobacteria bacterium]|nr:YaeQ family protein [Alphaproteobacteria bacterium]